MHTRYTSTRCLLTFAAACTIGASIHAQDEPLAHVRVSEQVVDGHVTYHYTVVNGGDHPIATLRVGYSAAEGMELADAPLGWTADAGPVAGTILGPTGWDGTVATAEETDNVRIDWLAPELDRTSDIAPGETRGGFSVTLGAVSNTYQASHWTIVYENGAEESGEFEPVPATPADGDITGVIVPNGPPLSLVFDTPGQNARFTFDADPGLRVSLAVSDITLTNGSVFLVGPDGETVTASVRIAAGQGNTFLDTTVLPSAGTWTIAVDPDGLNTGGVTLALFAVPPDVSGQLTLDTPLTIAIATPGQNGRLSLAGVSGQRVSFSFTNVSAAPASVSVLAPDGLVLALAGLNGSSGFMDAVTLPADGTYTVLIDPAGAAIGALTITAENASDVVRAISINGPPVTIAIGAIGQNARITFSGAANQRITLQLSNVTIAAGVVTILGPDGSAVASATATSAGATIADKTLALTGTYTILVDPVDTNTGGMTLTLWDALDVFVAITPGGPPVTVTTTSAGQNVHVTFSGAAGQRVSLLLSAVTFGTSSCCSMRVSILAPDGSTLGSWVYVGTSGGFIEPRTLPVAGSYAILLDPESSATGSATLTLYDVPLDAAGSLMPGGAPVTTTIAAPGQNARLTFDGTAGQRVSVELTGSTLASATVYLLNPDGTTLTSTYLYGNSGFLDAVTLGVSGVFTVLIDPSSASTGAVTVRLNSLTDFTGTIIAGGPPVTVSLSAPGQNAALTFTAADGERVSVLVTNDTIPASTIAIANPDGTTRASIFVGPGTSFIDTVALTAGTYTVRVDPSGSSLGNVTLTLYDVPADATGSLTLGGGGVTVSLGVPGQNAVLTFSALAGQKIMLLASSVTFGNATVGIVAPDNTVLASRAVGTGGGSIDNLTLTAGGTYRVTVDPVGANTGAVTLTLFDATDVLGTISADGVAVSFTIPSAGQTARVRFGGHAGQRVSLRLTNVTIGTSGCCGARVSINKPDATVLVSPAYVGTGGGFVDAVMLPVDGTYTILIDPDGSNTGSITLALYTVVDIVGSIAPSGIGVAVTISTPGQIANLQFAGAQGERVSLGIIASTLGSAAIAIVKPDGNILTSTFISGSSGFLDTVVLPVGGTYAVRLDPSGANLGSATSTLYDVPPDVIGTIQPGVPGVPVTITTPGQNALLTFAGIAGQRVSLALGTGSISSMIVAILKPDGSTVTSTFVGSGGGFLDVVTLPASGTYSVRLDPSGIAVGTVTTMLYDVSADVGGTIVPGGNAVTVGIVSPGQNAQLTFAAAANQRISLRLANVTLASVSVTLVKPDGSSLATAFVGTSGGFIDAIGLPIAGTYTIRVDPSSTAVGSITLTLYDVPADATTTLSVGGEAAALTTTTPGQNAAATVDAAAGQRVTVRFTGNTMGLMTVKLLRPDGTIATTVYTSSASFNLATQTLVATGTYTVTIDPGGTNIGTVNINVTTP